jgi:hypothetical protein
MHAFELPASAALIIAGGPQAQALYRDVAFFWTTNEV